MAASTALSSFADNDPDALLVCPYDPVHRISAKRYPYHLMKCRKNHSAGDFVQCPFNARHEMPRVELAYHLTICVDKDVIRQDVEQVQLPSSFDYSNRPRTPPPTQGIGEEHAEDWDLETEEDSAPFLPANFLPLQREQADSYAVIQNLQEAQQQLHGSTSEPVPGNVADMTPAQRKNYKRAQKRQQKRLAEGGDNDDDITEEQKRDDIFQRCDLLSGNIEGGFVDFVSILNQWCQKNKVNSPKYSEGPGVMGGFGAVVTIRTDRYSTYKHCKSKKDARQNAALVAVVALNVPVGDDPTPCRLLGVAAKTAAEKDRMRQIHEQRLLMQAGYNQPSSSASQPVATAPPAYQGVEQQMGGLSLNGQEEDDGWSTVPSKKGPAGVKNPVYNYSLKVAGRGRGAKR